MSKQLEKLFLQSNYVLFNREEDDKQIKDITIARKNLARSIVMTNTVSSEFDKLISSLEYSLESNNDLMALSIIEKINTTMINIATSFDSMLGLMGKYVIKRQGESSNEQ